ncbi:MAG TPA: DUF3037 domain-containing protein [Chloroflexia bacterium]|nr:DUF3037 domain-containing protein [Chloroflexia bacterium]
MPEQTSFDYGIIRVVPRVERGEFINAGIILFCRTRRYLAARVELNLQRLALLAPEADVEEIQSHLAVIPLICAGGKEAGPIGQLSLAERFHWLVAPRSTVIQVSPVHSGLCADPQKALEDLMARLVL